MDNCRKPEILTITTEDPSSTPVIEVADHEDNPFLLSPGPPKSGGRSIHTSADEDGIQSSPTLSTQSSVHFATSTALRANKSGDGTTPPAPVSLPSRAHSGGPSNSTAINHDANNEGTAVNHSPVISHPYLPISNVTTASARSATQTPNNSTSDIGESGSRIQYKQKSGEKFESGAQGTTEKGDDKHVAKEVQDNLSLFSRLLGGRFNSSSFILKSRRSKVPKSDRVASPPLVSVVPTIAATSVGDGGVPSQLDLSDRTKNDPPTPGRFVKWRRALWSVIHKYSLCGIT